MKNPCSCFKKLSRPTPCNPSYVPSSCNSYDDLKIFTCTSKTCCEPCKSSHDCCDTYPKPCAPHCITSSHHCHNSCDTQCSSAPCTPCFGKPYTPCHEYPNMLATSCQPSAPCHKPCDTHYNVCTSLSHSFDCYLNKQVRITFEDYYIRVRILNVCDDTLKAVLLSCGNIVYINCCRIHQIDIC